MAQLGWNIGTNLRVDVRWATGNAAAIRKHAAELAALAPDVILAHGGATVSPLQQATRIIPIVFTVASDPVATGYADSLARPGGNTTGFMTAEYSTAGKWLEMLKQVAPGVTRVAILRDPGVPAGLAQFSAIQTGAVSLGVATSPINVRDATEIERGIAAFARSPNGGLITYGPDTLDPMRRAAEYVDRIFKGEKPADLPVQAPVKYELVINLKTAKALGLNVPPTLLARADEVVE